MRYITFAEFCLLEASHLAQPTFKQRELYKAMNSRRLESLRSVTLWRASYSHPQFVHMLRVMMPRWYENNYHSHDETF